MKKQCPLQECNSVAKCFLSLCNTLGATASTTTTTTKKDNSLTRAHKRPYIIYFLALVFFSLPPLTLSFPSVFFFSFYSSTVTSWLVLRYVRHLHILGLLHLPFLLLRIFSSQASTLLDCNKSLHILSNITREDLFSCFDLCLYNCK